jgi:transcriptional regulator with XRE-family HTH domain
MTMYYDPQPGEDEDRFLLPFEELTRDEQLMWGMPRTYGWRTVAETLGAARKKLKLSKRQAARRAGISEGTWRQLERGPTLYGGMVHLTEARPENVYAAARAVGVEPEVIFGIFGEGVPEGLDFTPYDDRLAKKITRLEVRDRDIVERLVDSMLDDSIGDSPDDPEVPPESS